MYLVSPTKDRIVYDARSTAPGALFFFKSASNPTEHTAIITDPSRIDPKQVDEYKQRAKAAIHASEQMLFDEKFKPYVRASPGKPAFKRFGGR